QIEALNEELVIERQTQGAAEATLEHLRAEYIEADAKSQELEAKLAEAQKNLEQQVKERDEKNSELDSKLNRLHKRAKQQIQEDNIEERRRSMEPKENAIETLQQSLLEKEQFKRIELITTTFFPGVLGGDTGNESTYSLHYCPGVLGGDTGNGSTYSLNKCPGVLGGDTCDGDDEDEEPTPQPKPKEPKPMKETPIHKPYKPKIPYPQRLRKKKMEAQYGKFLDMIRAIRINVPLVDVLAEMPNYGKFLKELISNKQKIEQISAAFLSDESSAILQNKVSPKLRDP
ncbi:hypothetical protein Tco_0866276, partial [Tanacetum coccineum]